MSYKILIVDDEKKIRKSLSLILSESYYYTYGAENGAKALEMIKDPSVENFDLVITDVVMPKMDGLELAKEINKLNIHIDVLVMSAYEEDRIFEFCKVGCYRFIEKPLDPELLTNLIDQILSSNLGERIRALNIDPKSFMPGLVYGCPIGKCLDTCPFNEVRKKTMMERIDMIFGQSDEEIQKLYDIHSKCIRRRELLEIKAKTTNKIKRI